MSSCINCEWFRTNQVIINPDGQVYPCCYISNTLYLSKQYGYPKKGDLINIKNEDSLEYELQHSEGIAMGVPVKDWLYSEYIENEKEFNIDNKPLEEILNHEWFDKLKNSWEDDNDIPIPIICKTWCTVKKYE